MMDSNETGAFFLGMAAGMLLLTILGYCNSSCSTDARVTDKKEKYQNSLEYRLDKIETILSEIKSKNQ